MYLVRVPFTQPTSMSVNTNSNKLPKSVLQKEIDEVTFSF
jgi:hypothetical protein